MLQVEISTADLCVANYEREFNLSSRIRKRMNVLYLKGMNYAHKEIAKISGFSLNSVTNVLKRYNTGGLECLFYEPKNSTPSELKGYIVQIRQSFTDQPPHSVAEAQERIRKLTGIERAPTQTRIFMKQLGMRFRKTGHVPAKCNPDVQQEFLEKTLEPIIKKAEKGKCHLFFVDSAHFTWGVFLCCLWSFVRIFIKAPAGRFRYNVLGALHGVTHQVEMITNTTTVNAQTVIALMKKVARKFKDQPVYMVFDNARYMHNKMVKQAAASLGIQIIYLPSYSPNLNLIERLWKYIKKKALYGKYYDTFEKFRSAIDQCLYSINHRKSSKKELKTFLSLKFQTFRNSQNQAA
jgi:transposase